MSDSTFQGLWPGRCLSSTQVRLRAYSGEPILVLGCCCVNVSYKGQTGQFQFFVVEGTSPTLMGRDWLTQIQLDWRFIHHVRSPGLQTVLARYPTVFRDELGTLKGFNAKIYVDPDARPRFFPARTVPYAMCDMVEHHLQRLQDEGVLEPVDISEWVALMNETRGMSVFAAIFRSQLTRWPSSIDTRSRR